MTMAIRRKTASRRGNGKAGAVRTASWRGDVQRIRKDLKDAGARGQHALKAVTHNAAVAAFQWVTEHEGRVTAFRKSIRGTPVEKAVNAALRKVKKQATAPVDGARRRRRKTAKKAAGRSRGGLERLLAPPMF
jgi:hypothetical protein